MRLPVDSACLLIVDQCYLASAARELGIDENIANALVQRAVTRGDGVVYDLGADGALSATHGENYIHIGVDDIMAVCDPAEEWVYNIDHPAPNNNDDLWRRKRIVVQGANHG